MKTLNKSILLTTALIGAQLQAEPVLVSGWDFSQALFNGTAAGQDEETPGLFNPNYTYGGSSTADSANWEAASVKGAVYWNGSFGSTTVTNALDGTADLQMTVGENLDSLAAASFDEFNQNASYTKLLNSGQNEGTTPGGGVDALMNINADLTIVVEAKAGSAQSNWTFTYAAKDLDDGAAVSYEYSSDGTNYTDLGSDDLGTADTGYTVQLPDAMNGQSNAYLKMVFTGVNESPASGLQLDNFAFSASEGDFGPTPDLFILSNEASTRIIQNWYSTPMGTLFVGDEPWIWSNDYGWFYDLPANNETDAWVFMTAAQFNTWVYVDQASATSAGFWGYATSGDLEGWFWYANPESSADSDFYFIFQGDGVLVYEDE